MAEGLNRNAASFSAQRSASCRPIGSRHGTPARPVLFALLLAWAGKLTRESRPLSILAASPFPSQDCPLRAPFLEGVSGAVRLGSSRESHHSETNRDEKMILECQEELSRLKRLCVGVSLRDILDDG